MNEIALNKKYSKFGIYITCTLGTVVAGLFSGFLSGANNGYDGINMPTFALPSWSYSIIWTILFIMIGSALYMIVQVQPTSGTESAIRTACLILWWLQISLNLLWPFIFFNLDYTIAFVINCALFAVVTSLVILGLFIRPTVSALLLPYWLWLGFATIQTLSIIVLNA